MFDLGWLFAMHAVLALLINEWMDYYCDGLGLVTFGILNFLKAKLQSWQPWSKNRSITSSAELKTSLLKGNLHFIHSSESDFACKIGGTQSNETVSLGDTAISLHTLPVVTFLGGGVFLASQNSKCQVLANFSFSEGGDIHSRVVKSKSAQFWPTFRFWEGVGVFLGSQKSKCQVMANFSFRDGRGKLLKNRVFLAKWAKNSWSPACCCIADILSHTTCVETSQERGWSFSQSFQCVRPLSTIVYGSRRFEVGNRPFKCHFVRRKWLTQWPVMPCHAWNE